ncbi:hypothetical protein DICPUDRAFT_159218 [Dictyostelium purpureum]|uniref:Uncharacterized protein n=1 Tax=Dictyostelium purpureum TaxID=5786 RepID=F1A3K4_DICPU|nr:uncharacterized protein DICPUDRAFT_159218 [Dictyostelium purpureum]EGC29223.1 hypothetical protein DICPUDRAFT_159218 [Dictyostelium purpureum]|eukprot:XP_003294245.1 hypothetical protein DICPUDRAFT_159218 [Dictyostelium purpureum]
MRLLIVLVLAFLAASAHGSIVHTFDHFTIRNSDNKLCFVYANGTTADATQADIGKCVAGCGGSIKVVKAKRSNQYIFSQYTTEDCTGTAAVDSDFLCPNPSIKPVELRGNGYSIKCGTNPKAAIEDDENAIDEVPKSKSKGGNNKPKHDSNEIADFSVEESSESTKTKPKSPKSGSTDEENASATEETNTHDSGNSASATIASLSLVLGSLIATLAL